MITNWTQFTFKVKFCTPCENTIETKIWNRLEERESKIAFIEKFRGALESHLILNNWANMLGNTQNTLESHPLYFSIKFTFNTS